MKKIPIVVLLIIFIYMPVIPGLLSCNASNESKTAATEDSAAIAPLPDSVGGLPDSIAIAPPPVQLPGDTTFRGEDTAFVALLPDPPSPPFKRTAVLGYSHPGVIQRNESKSINVYVTVRHPESLVKDTLRKLIALQEITVEQNDTSHIYTRNIALYTHLSVTLIDPANVFTTTKIHNNDRQELDTLKGNRWRWNIVTSTDKPEAVLILKVVAEKPGVPLEDFDDENIRIKIYVDNNSLWRGIWLYLVDHPGTVVTAILIPLIGFLGKWYFEKRKKAGQ